MTGPTPRHGGRHRHNGNGNGNGHGGGPGAGFRVPDDHIGILIDLPGAAPFTFLYEVAEFPLLILSSKVMRSEPLPALLRAVAGEIAEGKRRADPTDLRLVTVVLGALLRDPYHGDTMGREVVRQLRETGRAYLSCKVTPAGYAMALADRFVNLGAILGDAPQGVVMMVSGDPRGSNAPWLEIRSRN